MCLIVVEASWNVMAHAQKPDYVFRRNRWVHLNGRRRQFSRLLAAEMCASAVVMLDTPCSEVVWKLLATHSIRQFPLHFPSRASPCAITFQLDSTDNYTFDRLFANPYSTNKSTVLLLCISLLISCYMFRLNCHHQGANTNMATAYSNKIVVQCFRIENVHIIFKIYGV